MPNIISWRNSFSAVAYPFSEASFYGSDGSALFPVGLIADAQFMIPSYIAGDLRLSSSSNSGTRLSLTFSVGNTEIGTATILTGTINNAVAQVTSEEGVIVGTLVFGADAARARQSIPLGTRPYSASTMFIEQGCVFRFPSNVLCQITTDAGTARGKVALIEGTGVRLVKEAEDLLRIDCVGDPESVRDCCGVSGTPLRKLNEAVPNDSGSVYLNTESYSEPSTVDDDRQSIRIEFLPGRIIFSLNA